MQTYVLIHTPLTDETRGLINLRIESMKKSAFLINVASCQIVDRDALFTDLINRKLQELPLFSGKSI
jgi:phosphoglycerate dehydrogenase-like enzyme